MKKAPTNEKLSHWEYDTYPAGFYLFDFDHPSITPHKYFEVEATMLTAYAMLRGMEGADWRAYELEQRGPHRYWIRYTKED